MTLSPKLHPQAVTLLELMASIGDPPLDALPAAESRALRRQRVRPSGEAVFAVDDISVGNIVVRRYRPSIEARAAIIWMHGGGWVLGDLDSHDGLCRSLANTSGAVVLAVQYRLAPEDPFPAGLADAIEATRLIVAQADELGIDPMRVAIGGDSAGGNLVAVVSQLGVVALRAQALAYPVTDCRMETESYREFAEDHFLTQASMHWFYNQYAPTTDRSDPRVSPLLAPATQLAASPTTVVLTCECDPLHDEGVAFHDALVAAGVVSEHWELPGMPHGALTLAPYLDVGAEALQRLGQRMAQLLA
jgi:acetyl esterase